MKAWSYHFTGHWPVGACAVVVAPDLIAAGELLSRKLTDIGLGQALPLNKFTEIDLRDADAHILLDGNY